jgi:Gpi18-like mannosyltransferase
MITAAPRTLSRYAGAAIIAAAFGMSLCMRWLARDVVTGDYTLYLQPWIEFIQAQGGWPALRYNFSNYAPPYLYLLVVASGIFNSVPALYLSKLISLPFDLGCAWMAYKLVKLRYPDGIAPHSAFAAVLLLPTLLGNGAIWGQADSTYTFFLLVCIYALCMRRHGLAMICFGLALAFKLQALFFLPVIVILLFKRELPAVKLLWIPAVLLFAHAPAAWLGRPLDDVLGIYLAQAGTNEPLVMNAPTWFTWLPHEPFDVMLWLGVLAAGVACLLLLLVALRSKANATPDFIIRLSTAVLLVVPFLLPKMHERYFFAGEVTSVVLAFFAPAWWLVPVAAQFASSITYGGYLARFGHLVDLRFVAPFMAFAAIASVVAFIHHARSAQPESLPALPPSRKVQGLLAEVVALAGAIAFALLSVPVGAQVQQGFNASLTATTFIQNETRIRTESLQASQCGDEVRLSIAWPEVRNLAAAAAVFVHVYDAGGNRIAVADGDLLDNTLPLSQWRGFVYDQRRIPLPDANAQAGAVHVGVYDRQTLQRLPAFQPSSAPWPADEVIVPVRMLNCR